MLYIVVAKLRFGITSASIIAMESRHAILKIIRQENWVVRTKDRRSYYCTSMYKVTTYDGLDHLNLM